jgi:uncharacterized protein YrrD
MVHSLNEVLGLSIAATDGELGTIDDVYFDDAQWTVRYLVVDTGGWITGRNVLIPLHALAGADWPAEKIRVNLTKQQVNDSPGINTAKPVSRQHETDLYNHYGYPYYWSGPYMWGEAVFPTVFEKQPLEDPERQRRRERMERKGADPHLRSFNEVTGYKIQATDDTVGHVEDFLFDDKDWSIQLIAVDTRNWLPGKAVLISPERIRDVSWADKKVMVDISREEVENSPEYDPANPPPLGPKYDLYRRFGMPHS